MAIYHQSVKPVQRSKGRSATASAAYRSGEKIRDEREAVLHDYSRRHGVEHTELVGWEGDRSELWNAAEAAERRKDATVAREYEIALPRELDREARVELAHGYAEWLHDRHGVAVDVAVHDHDSGNPHAHLMATTREVGADGHSLGDKAAVEWSDKKRKEHGLPGRKSELSAAREAWQEHANDALGHNGHEARIDHRSLSDQREAALDRGDPEQAQALDRQPTQHLGPAANAIEHDGVESERGDTNREIEAENDERQGLYAQIQAVGQSINQWITHINERLQRGVKTVHDRLQEWNDGVDQGEERMQEKGQQYEKEKEQQQQLQKQQEKEKQLERLQRQQPKELDDDEGLEL